MNDTETPAPSRETLGSGAACYTLSAKNTVLKVTDADPTNDGPLWAFIVYYRDKVVIGGLVCGANLTAAVTAAIAKAVTAARSLTAYRAIAALGALDLTGLEPGDTAADEVVDSIVACDVVLNLDNLINDTLILPDELLAVLGESDTYIVALHQPGAELDADERVQRVTRNGDRLVGIAWPLSFHDAVTVSVTRGGCRVRVDDLAYVGR